ncbi:MAG: hypothetical protein P0S94_05025 [Simkaniaceae bacterium]|nr:hypothetical protein [Simkaniaceae bacterium]
MLRAKIARMVLESWWVAIVLFVIAALYLQGVRKKEGVIERLETQLAHVESSFEQAQSKRNKLAEEIASQSDPEWVEIVLMRKLGVVPEGHTKVYFR